MHDNKKVSIVVSIYNEQDGLANFWKTLRGVLQALPDHNFEVLWVNDGSVDGSQHIVDKEILSKQDANISHCAMEFSKNYGHEAAMIAGIDVATGNSIICLDADLQHPPSMIPEILAEQHQAYDIILMSRSARADHSKMKQWMSRRFYKLLNHMSVFEFEENSSDFFCISARVADILRNNFRERNRFLRGYIQAIGFPKITLEYKADARKFGESNYSYRSLFQLTLNALFSFSNKPLRLSLVISVVFILFTILIGGVTLYTYFFGEKPPSGYTTIVLFQSVAFSILFLLVAILSVYFGKNLEETRQRPIYLIKNLKRKEANF